MEIKELGHIVLYVRDIDASRQFYENVLGWQAITPEGSSRGACAFVSGSHRTHHELLLLEVGPDAPLPPPGRRAGLYHFGLKVGETDDELREAIATCQANGVRIVGASDHTVTHSLYILDPDGNEIELYIDVQPEIWHDEPMAVMSPTKPLRI
jgi:catechol 2,3-dioxygenase